MIEINYSFSSARMIFVISSFGWMNARHNILFAFFSLSVDQMKRKRCLAMRSLTESNEQKLKRVWNAKRVAALNSIFDLLRFFSLFFFQISMFFFCFASVFFFSRLLANLLALQKLFLLHFWNFRIKKGEKSKRAMFRASSFGWSLTRKQSSDTNVTSMCGKVFCNQTRKFC